MFYTSNIKFTKREWDPYTPKQMYNTRRSKDYVYLARQTVYIPNERFESDLYTRKENNMTRTCSTDKIASNRIRTNKDWNCIMALYTRYKSPEHVLQIMSRANRCIYKKRWTLTYTGGVGTRPCANSWVNWSKHPRAQWAGPTIRSVRWARLCVRVCVCGGSSSWISKKGRGRKQWEGTSSHLLWSRT